MVIRVGTRGKDGEEMGLVRQAGLTEPALDVGCLVVGPRQAGRGVAVGGPC